MPAIATVSPTGDTSIDAVLSGTKWAVNSLTFSFPSDPTFYGSNYGSGENLNAFEAFTAQQQAAVRSILDNYSAVINFTFSEVTETATQHGTLRYAESNSPSTAWGYYPTTAEIGGDMWFNNTSGWYDYPVQGNYGWLTMMHETGHALGLKHPQTTSGSFGVMPPEHDSLEYTVMSYRSYVGGPTTGLTNEAYGYPQTLMMYDIAALQEMYGANYTTNSGNSVYTWDPTTGVASVNGVAYTAPGANKVFMTVWDGGGEDTYDFSNYATGVSVNLQPGGWTITSTAQLAYLGNGHYAAGNIANALLHDGNTVALIENAIGGSGNDTIIGNSADNKLTGNKGDDVLGGGAGVDTAIYSGLAADYQWLQNADGSWTVVDLRGAGFDGTDALRDIEFLKFLDSVVQIGTPPVTPTNVTPTITSGAQTAQLTEWPDLSLNEKNNVAHNATGTITYSDTDKGDLHTAAFTAKGTGYLGTFALNTSTIDSSSSVGWSYSVSDKAIDYLAAGQTLTQSYDVSISDGHGGTAIQTVTITLIGEADATTARTTGKGGGVKGKGPEVVAGNEQGSDDLHHDQMPAPATSDTLVFKTQPAAQQGTAQFDSHAADAAQVNSAAAHSLAVAFSLASDQHVPDLVHSLHDNDWLLN